MGSLNLNETYSYLKQDNQFDLHLKYTPFATCRPVKTAIKLIKVRFINQLETLKFTNKYRPGKEAIEISQK